MNSGFTLSKYGELCSAIKENYETLTFNEYLNTLNFKNKFIILRHDVDRMPGNALKTAKVEHEFNLKSTYYFRVNKAVFIKEIIEEIASLGHEIGGHYEWALLPLMVFPSISCDSVNLSKSNDYGKFGITGETC